MAKNAAYNSVVAARTRAADQILRTKELLNLYEGSGGLKEDLEQIRDAGRRAEALNLGQSEAQAAGGAATGSVLERFEEVQREYKAVMAVVQAARLDLARQNASAETVAALDKILLNEAEVTIVDELPGAGPSGKKRKKAKRSSSQEALRAEIAKDAGALVGLKAAHTALGRRKVDTRRLGHLVTAVGELSGLLSVRATTKGKEKESTASERAAVNEQRALWGGCYRIIAAVGRTDTRIAALLKEAARK